MNNQHEIRPIIQFDGNVDDPLKLIEDSNSKANEKLKNYLIIALWKDKCQSFRRIDDEKLFKVGINKLIESQILPKGIDQDIFNPVIQQVHVAFENIFANLIKNNMNQLLFQSNISDFIEIRLSSTPKNSSNKFIIESKYKNDFKFVKHLGTGGFGQVNMVKKKADENIYAIKFLKHVKEGDSRYIYREITQMSKLNHPNIVRYYDAWCELDFDINNNYNINANVSTKGMYSNDKEDSESVLFKEDENKNGNNLKLASEFAFESDYDDVENTESKRVEKYNNYIKDNADFKILVFYIQMEACDMDLSTYFQNENYDIRDRKKFMKHIVKGLKYLHANDIVHRDLKPNNILLNIKEKTAKITDFGLSRSLTKSNIDVFETTNMSALLIENDKLTNNIGTPSYAAPETLKSDKYTEKVDIFSLGLIMYEMFKKLNTISERQKMINLLRKSEKDVEFNQEFPNICNMMYQMLDFIPENRPSTQAILESSIFDLKCSKCNDLKKEIEILQKKLKEAEIKLLI